MPRTSHLTESDLAAALDAANTPARARARAHARVCATCKAALEGLRAHERETGHWLEALDHPVPDVDVRGVLGRSAHPRARQPARTRQTGRVTRIPGWLGATLLVTVAAAAAAAPVSSIRRFVERMTHAAVRRAPPAPAADIASGVARQQSLRGVVVVPAGTATITFDSPQRRGSVRIASVAAAALTVEADADGPTYTVGAAGVIVHNRATDTAGYHVLVPARRAVRVVIAGLTAFERLPDAGDSTAESRAGDVVVPLQRRPIPADDRGNAAPSTSRF